MPLIEFLDGISPWWWVAFALALGALEMATFSFFLLWPALSALIVAILLALAPDLSPASQIIIFSVMSVLLTFAGRYLVMKFGDGGGSENEALNNRGSRFVGRNASVLEYSNGHGVIQVDGMRWRANWPENTKSDVGSEVRVTKADGLTLDVEPIQS